MPQALARDHHAFSDRVGGRGGHSGRRPPRRGLGRRAVPPARRGPGRRPRARHRPAPGARRRARRDGRGPRPSPSTEWKVRYALLLGLERVLSERPPHLASGTELRRHQVDALAGMLTELIAATQKAERTATATATATPKRLRPTRTTSRRTSSSSAERGARRRAGAAVVDDPGADPPLPLPPSDRVGQDDRGRGLRRGRAHRRRPDPHPPPPARRPVPARADRARLRRPPHRRRPRRATRAARVPNPITIQTYAWFARHVGEIARDAYQLVICDEAHTALGEKTSAAIRTPRRARSTSA